MDDSISVKFDGLIERIRRASPSAEALPVRQAAAELSSLISCVYETRNGRLYTRLVLAVSSLKSQRPEVVRAVSLKARLRFRHVRKVRGSLDVDMAADWPAGRVASLSDAVAASLGEGAVSLRPNSFQGCSSTTFRGNGANGHQVFVKLGSADGISRARAVLRACEGLAFIPRMLGDEALSFEGHSVLVTELLPSMDVERLERLSLRQVRGLAVSYRQFSERIQSLRPVAEGIGAYSDLAADLSAISAFVARHPRASRGFSDLLDVSSEAVAGAGRMESVVHGDFTHVNYGFGPDGLAAIYDYDALAFGFPCYELSLTVPGRYCARHLGAFARRRLRGHFAEMVRVAGYSADDWRLALTMQRIRWTAGAIRRHPSPLKACLSAHRFNSRLCELMEMLK